LASALPAAGSAGMKRKVSIICPSDMHLDETGTYCTGAPLPSIEDATMTYKEKVEAFHDDRLSDGGILKREDNDEEEESVQDGNN